MANVKYIEIIKSKLSNAGYSSALLDALSYQVIEVADTNAVDALELLDQMIGDNIDLRKNKDFNAIIPQTSNGMSFTTYRHSNPAPNKFIDRQIIIR